MNEKKYFWLKLKDDFFKQKEIKKLRKIAGGDTYTIIYLKMQLLSLKNEGKLYFDGIEDNFASEIALELDEMVADIELTIAYLLKHNLLELQQDEYLLPQTMLSIGKESDSAERVRKSRENKKLEQQKVLHCNSVVTKCNTEIEIEKDIEIKKEINIKEEKTKYKDFVSLTQIEFEKLVEQYDKVIIDTYIDKLNNYIGSKGTKYKSHYFTLLNWLKRDNIKTTTNAKEDEQARLERLQRIIDEED